MGKEQTESTDHLISLFRRRCEHLERVLNDLGYSANAYIDRSMCLFSKYCNNKQLQILFDINRYIDCIETTLAMNESPKDSAKFLWRSLRVYGMKCPHDFTDKIKENDVVELYDLEHTQIWRNLVFFDICSYTIEHVFCEPWLNRYSREGDFTKKCIEVVSDCIKGDFLTSLVGVEQHLLKENFSERRYTIKVSHTHLAPTRWANCQLGSGYLVITLAEVISSEEINKGSTKHQAPHLQLI